MRCIVDAKKGGIVPVHHIGQGVTDLAGGKRHPGRSTDLGGVDDLFHRAVDEEVRGVPVFSAAAMGEDEIGVLEVVANLTGENLDRDLGGEDFESFRHRIDVPEENEFIDPEHRAGFLHLGG